MTFRAALLLATAAGAMSAAGCAGTPGTGQPEDDLYCLWPDHMVPVFWIGEREAAAGETIALNPVWASPYAGTEPIEAHCVEPVNLSDGAPAALSSDGTALRISPDAAHNAVFEVETEVMGEPVIGRVRVVDAAMNPIAGTWSQSDVVCESGIDPVTRIPITPPHVPARELVLGANGRFSVTWQPFESYTDYWGTYAYDVETGRIEMSIEGGNQIPRPFDGAGEAVIVDGRLELRNVYLGQPELLPPLASCTYTFR